MSIPEVLLVLERSDRMELARLALDTHSRHLAAASVWSTEAGSALARFQREVRGAQDGAPKIRATDPGLSALLNLWGVPLTVIE